MSEELRSVVKEWIEAVNQGDIKKIKSLYTDGAKHAAPHRGWVTDAKDFFEKYSIHTLPNTKSFEYYIKSIVVEGNRACAQFEDHAIMKDGREYYNYGVLAFVFEGKKIKSTVEYVDSLRYLVWGKRWDGDALMNARIAVPY